MILVTFAIFGMVSGFISAIPVTYVIYFVLKIPNIEKNMENLPEFIGLMRTLIIFGILEGFKLCYKLFFKEKRNIKIYFIGATFISILVAIISVYSITQTELWIEKELIVTHPIILAYSIGRYPLLLLVIFISSFISVWTTMPNWLRKIVDFLKIFEVIEEYQ